MSIINLFHIIFVGCLFVYVGHKNVLTSKLLFHVLLFLGIIIILYHSYKAYEKINNKINPTPVINYIHIFFIGPLLIYIGFYKEKTNIYLFKILLMLGFAAIGYHLYRLYFV